MVCDASGINTNAHKHTNRGRKKCLNISLKKIIIIENLNIYVEKNSVNKEVQMSK